MHINIHEHIQFGDGITILHPTEKQRIIANLAFETGEIIAHHLLTDNQETEKIPTDEEKKYLLARLSQLGHPVNTPSDGRVLRKAIEAGFIFYSQELEAKQ